MICNSNNRGPLTALQNQLEESFLVQRLQTEGAWYEIAIETLVEDV